MTTRQDNKLKMNLATRIFLLEHPEVLAQIPHSADFMAELNEGIALIQENDNEMAPQQRSAGTTNKGDLREILEKNIMSVSGNFQAFAAITGNTLLLNETRITVKMLAAASEIRLISIANTLHGVVGVHLIELEPYKLTSATQSLFRANITNFESAIPHHSNKEVKRQGHSRTLDDGFDKADHSLSMFDYGVEIVRYNEPDFYAGYKLVRKIPEYGTGTLQVQGTITDAATAKPIPGVTITFFAQGTTNPVLTKKTAAGGGINIKSLPERIYDVTIEKTGYKTYTGSIVVVFEALARLDVQLETL